MHVGAPSPLNRHASTGEPKGSKNTLVQRLTMTTPPPRQRTPRPTRSIAAIGASIAIVLGAFVSLGACILADPPAEVEPVAPTRPIILRESVVPSPGRILRTWPDAFILPVEADPASVVAWKELLDYDPGTVLASDSLPHGQSDPNPASQDGGIRLIPIEPIQPPLDQCHTLEIIVAHAFVPNSQVPQAPGGDSVSWFYAPTGDLSTCPQFDASVLDAQDESQ